VFNLGTVYYYMKRLILVAAVLTEFLGASKGRHAKNGMTFVRRRNRFLQYRVRFRLRRPREVTDPPKPVKAPEPDPLPRVNVQFTLPAPPPFGELGASRTSSCDANGSNSACSRTSKICLSPFASGRGPLHSTNRRRCVACFDISRARAAGG